MVVPMAICRGFWTFGRWWARFRSVVTPTRAVGGRADLAGEILKICGLIGVAMSRSQFRFLVVVNQLLIIAMIPVQEISEQLMLPQSGAGTSVLEQGIAPFTDIPYWVGNAILIAGFIAAIGLCYGKRWGRTLFLLTTVAVLFSTFLNDFFVSTSWSGFVSYLACITDGMILGLAYFSHIKRMFETDTGESN
jgi:hypothetical protein